MNIPTLLVDQWIEEHAASEDEFHSGYYIAQRAAEWALSQPVSMEPVGEAYLCEACETPFDGGYECPTCGHNTAIKDAVYTATQLAAARQQGADEWMERAKDAEKCEDAYAKRIAELEKSNAQLLEALKQIQRTGYTDVGDWMMIDAAIKAAKEERSKTQGVSQQLVDDLEKSNAVLLEAVKEVCGDLDEDYLIKPGSITHTNIRAALAAAEVKP